MTRIFQINKYKKINCNGQSILEIILTLAIFAIVVSTVFVFSMQGLINLERSSYYAEALSLLNEGEEAIRTIGRTDWDNLAYDQSAVSIDAVAWALSGEGTVEDLNNFSRTIYFSDVYRDDNNLIVDAGHALASLDTFSKYADIQVEWQVVNQQPIILNREILLTNYSASTTP